MNATAHNRNPLDTLRAAWEGTWDWPEKVAASNASRSFTTEERNNRGLDAQTMHGKLDAARIRLHAVLIGSKNAALRSIADVYQEIPERGVVRTPVRRGNTSH